jgi:hypothetical protein
LASHGVRRRCTQRELGGYSGYSRLCQGGSRQFADVLGVEVTESTGRPHRHESDSLDSGHNAVPHDNADERAKLVGWLPHLEAVYREVAGVGPRAFTRYRSK